MIEIMTALMTDSINKPLIRNKSLIMDYVQKVNIVMSEQFLDAIFFMSLRRRLGRLYSHQVCIFLRHLSTITSCSFAVVKQQGKLHFLPPNNAMAMAQPGDCLEV